jgi:predicted O-methyltransferase YrrM
MGILKEIRQMVRDVRDIADHIRKSPSRRLDHVPSGEEMFKALCASALRKSVLIIEQEMPNAIIHQEHEAFLAYSLARAPHQGAHCEFGVYAGTSINLLAEMRPSGIFDGFDSFHGLPEAWTGFKEFDFDRKGMLPQVRENVRLHVGLFDATLPGYIRSCGPVSFLHIDCDLYSSTACVFKHIGPLLAPGCVIVFDEYFAYPGFEHHERKAFAEYLLSSGRTANWIACCGPRAACVLI